jgi:hypothetical protein
VAGLNIYALLAPFFLLRKVVEQGKSLVKRAGYKVSTTKPTIFHLSCVDKSDEIPLKILQKELVLAH